MAGDEFGSIVARLEGISEELADVAMSRLRDAIEMGESDNPIDEKVITRARRAVEKAIHLLEPRELH